LPAILDSFTPLSQMIIYGGGQEWWEPQNWWVFLHVEVDTARKSHLRPIQALDITNSSQFDGQASGQSCGDFQPGGCLSSHTTAI